MVSDRRPNQWTYSMDDGEKYCQPSLNQTICNDCIYYGLVEDTLQCSSPDEFQVNCATVVFCNSFVPMQEVESPCVSFDDRE